jgi:hypothetical protein
VRPSPLPNRVDPFGALAAAPERGRWLGNRGGRFHCQRTQDVSGRPWATRQWICCRLAFKGRRRSVWGHGYTELFFADEASALAAGHRPCFECRRDDAAAFARAWGRAQGAPPVRAPQMDAALHAERLSGRQKRLHRMAFAELPVGAMVSLDDRPFLVVANALLPWSFGGYGAPLRRPSRGAVDVLTPPSIIGALAAGYAPAEMRQGNADAIPHQPLIALSTASGVAGASSLIPAPFAADSQASAKAEKTEIASITGGSPTAFDA